MTRISTRSLDFLHISRLQCISGDRRSNFPSCRARDTKRKVVLCKSLLVSQWCTRATRWLNNLLHCAFTLEGAHRFGRRALPQIHLCGRAPCPRLPLCSVTGSGAVFWSELEQQPHEKPTYSSINVSGSRVSRGTHVADVGRARPSAGLCVVPGRVYRGELLLPFFSSCARFAFPQ